MSEKERKKDAEEWFFVLFPESSKFLEKVKKASTEETQISGMIKTKSRIHSLNSEEAIQVRAVRRGRC